MPHKSSRIKTIAASIRKEQRQKISVPSYISAAARKGLELRKQGYGGAGLTEQTIREARLMANGVISADKIKRANAWGARHAVDLQSSKNSNRKNENFPGPGAVAHYLWGINPTRPKSARKWFEGKSEMQKSEDGSVIEGEVVKFDTEQQLVFGWAYVAMNKEGKVVYDKSGDFVDEESMAELEKSAYDFVLKTRVGDEMHDFGNHSTLVESMIFTPDKIEKLGLTGNIPVGWWVGFHVDNPDLWSRYQSGERVAFSIGGVGSREQVASSEE